MDLVTVNTVGAFGNTEMEIGNFSYVDPDCTFEGANNANEDPDCTPFGKVGTFVVDPLSLGVTSTSTFSWVSLLAFAF